MSGTSGSRLDQAVKGAAPLATSSVALLNSRPGTPKDGSAGGGGSGGGGSTGSTGSGGGLVGDAMASLPSSPPQIYLNLLILEASLRAQYLTQRDRRRQNTFFILLLALWVAYFAWALFLAPREDGSGIGGSVYWVVETGQKVALMGGVVTGVLIWGTGQWERGVRRPRRFVGLANRGLRAMNCKLVVLRGPWWRETLGHLAFLFPWAGHLFSASSSSSSSFSGPRPGEPHAVDLLFRPSSSSSSDHRPQSSHGPGGRHSSNSRRDHHHSSHGHHRHGHGGPNSHANAVIHLGDGLEYVRGEDLSPGGDHVRLLLLPKPFGPDFRENWELYRGEYWERENERRALLRQRLAELERARAKEEAGRLWWVPGRGRPWGGASSSGQINGNFNNYGPAGRSGSMSSISSSSSSSKRGMAMTSSGGAGAGAGAVGGSRLSTLSAADLDRRHTRTASEARRASTARRSGEGGGPGNTGGGHHSRNASRASQASMASFTSFGSYSSGAADDQSQQRPVSCGSIVSHDGRRRSARNSIGGGAAHLLAMNAVPGGNNGVGGAIGGNGGGGSNSSNNGATAPGQDNAAQGSSSAATARRSGLATAPPMLSDDEAPPPPPGFWQHPPANDGQR